MPICTTCTSFVPYLYTVYQSAYNLRLEQCSACHSFADPYVEHDSLTLLLDLILLKRGVYRHLLYNRGMEPRREGVLASTSGTRAGEMELQRWLHVMKLGATLVSLDAFIRWSYLNARPPWTGGTFDGALRVLLGCLAETLAFHASIIIAHHIVFTSVAWVQAWRRKRPADTTREFRISLIPLALFYSSLTKLFLLLLLTVWRPTSTPSVGRGGTLLPARIFEIFDDDKIDREWLIRNVLGGMSAGFGLRVILDAHPVFTSLIILTGWKAKTVVAGLVGSWVGGDDMTGNVWQAYSIP